MAFFAQKCFYKHSRNKLDNRGWGDNHIFAFTHDINNRFQKKLVRTQIYEYVLPPITELATALKSEGLIAIVVK